MSNGTDNFPKMPAWPTPAKLSPEAAEEKEKHKAMIKQLGKPIHGHAQTINEAAQLAGMRKLRAHLGTMESALTEYANTSRDIYEQLDARKALDVVRELQQIGVWP